jgi:DNA-binding MarR family transcriptional regulator
MANAGHTKPELDALLHQPVRTRIVAFLAGRDEATFTEIKQALGLTDGNLDAHMKKLVSAAYIVPRRVAGNRPQTLYALSDLGRAAFRLYVTALAQVLRLQSSE